MTVHRWFANKSCPGDYLYNLHTPEALDTQVEKMLNEGGFSKSDFIVVQVIDYTIDANGYTGIADNAETQEPTTE